MSEHDLVEKVPTKQSRKKYSEEYTRKCVICGVPFCPIAYVKSKTKPGSFGVSRIKSKTGCHGSWTCDRKCYLKLRSHIARTSKASRRWDSETARVASRKAVESRRKNRKAVRDKQRIAQRARRFLKPEAYIYTCKVCKCQFCVLDYRKASADSENEWYVVASTGRKLTVCSTRCRSRVRKHEYDNSYACLVCGVLFCPIVWRSDGKEPHATRQVRLACTREHQQILQEIDVAMLREMRERQSRQKGDVTRETRSLYYFHRAG